MKRNAIGHMNPEKKSFFSFFKRIHFLPLLLCLILALAFWLVVKAIPSREETVQTSEETQNKSEITESLSKEEGEKKIAPQQTETTTEQADSGSDVTENAETTENQTAETETGSADES
ncbi:MAG: hypothetical protein IJR88_01635 [Clostridia bacterium]|nr:hypothetical protein [Clostridia bacterium]